MSLGDTSRMRLAASEDLITLALNGTSVYVLLRAQDSGMSNITKLDGYSQDTTARNGWRKDQWPGSASAPLIAKALALSIMEWSHTLLLLVAESFRFDQLQKPFICQRQCRKWWETLIIFIASPGALRKLYSLHLIAQRHCQDIVAAGARKILWRWGTKLVGLSMHFMYNNLQFATVIGSLVLQLLESKRAARWTHRNLRPAIRLMWASAYGLDWNESSVWRLRREYLRHGGKRHHYVPSLWQFYLRLTYGPQS